MDAPCLPYAPSHSPGTAATNLVVHKPYAPSHSPGTAAAHLVVHKPYAPSHSPGTAAAHLVVHKPALQRLAPDLFRRLDGHEAQVQRVVLLRVGVQGLAGPRPGAGLGFSGSWGPPGPHHAVRARLVALPCA
jgi:hypothetical protein